ncbi:hypothetical protein AVEN_42654-1 [Araneus ventricosus]|uniref:Uncharacterized protein n=1 Tax=Araneus ventricosus TaxID=182803 RepID=A0A4Y2BPT5_ARAVE|nr:hypothetical protein AVEN_42654-1 [Araneus ventricosus]
MLGEAGLEPPPPPMLHDYCPTARRKTLDRVAASRRVEERRNEGNRLLHEIIIRGRWSSPKLFFKKSVLEMCNLVLYQATTPVGRKCVIRAVAGGVPEKQIARELGVQPSLCSKLTVWGTTFTFQSPLYCPLAT